MCVAHRERGLAHSAHCVRVGGLLLVRLLALLLHLPRLVVHGLLLGGLALCLGLALRHYLLALYRPLGKARYK